MVNMTMQVGELARRTATTPRALRYYEAIGLLTPERQENGYRRYCEADVARVRHIQLLYRSGLCGSKIVEVLHLMCEASPGDLVISSELAEAVKETRTIIADHIGHLSTTLERLDALITLSRR